MVGKVKMTLGASTKERAGQLALSNYNKGYGAQLTNYKAPTPKSEVKVGYVPTGATGVVPKTSGEEAIDNYVAPVEATKLESIGATMMGSLAVDVFRNTRSTLIYERDPDFVSDKLSGEFFTKHGAGTPQEVKYLADSKSYQDWKDKTQYILDKRMSQQAQADNPLTAGLASIIDIDLALTAVPILGWAGKGAKVAKGATTAERLTAASVGYKVGAASTKGGRLAQRAGAGAIAGAGMLGYQSLQGDSTLRTEAQQMGDVAVVSLARMFAPLAKGKAVTANPVAPTRGYAGDVQPVDQSGFIGAPKPLPLTATQKAAQQEALKAVDNIRLTNAEIDSLPKKGRGAVRRAMLAEKKATARAKITANTIAPPVQQATKVTRPTQPLDMSPRLTPDEIAQNQVRLEAIERAKVLGATDAEIAALPVAEQEAAEIVRSISRAKALETAEALPVATPKPPTVAQAAEEQAKQVADDLTALTASKAVEQDLATIINRAVTESPPQAVARHPIIAKLQSVADELNYYTQGDTNTVVNKLYSNPAINNGDDVVSAQNVYWNNYNHKLIAFEDAMKDAVAVLVKGKIAPRLTGEYTAARKSVDSDFQTAMQQLDAEVLAHNKLHGVVPDNETIYRMLEAQGNHPSLTKAMRAYIDSDLAVKVYDDAYEKGWLVREVTDDVTGEVTKVNGFDDIVRRPTYTPLRHSYDKIENTVFSGKASWDEIHDFVGAQIVRMYPDLLKPKNAAKTFVLTERQVGQHFIQTQKDSARSLADVTATGMNKEQIADLLTKTGNMTDKDARIIAADIFNEMHKKGTSVPKHLRKRIEWDWNMTRKTSTGETLSMRDFVEDNVMGTLEDYSRGMAYRNGLSDYGINSEAELVNLLEGYLSKLPKGTNVQQARQFMKNTVDTMMGRSIDNNPVPQGIRSAQAIADLFLLAASGLYTFVDIATQLTKVGLIRSMSGTKQGLRVSFNNLSKLSHTEAKSLEDIISGRLLAGSKFKNFNARYADNFEVSGGIHEAAQFYGQTARFLNLSESLKRFQVGMLSSVYVSNLKGAMKGTASELKFMREKLKIPEDTIIEMQAEYAKHGTKIDDWKNSVRVKYERAVFHDADNLAMNVHRGEVPAILEFSPVGRVIFPYMRYMFGMQNKVLRRTINRDGYTGLAMLLAVQVPTATMVAAVNNIRKGKEPDEDLLVGALRVSTALGSLNYPMEIALAGLEGGGVTALVPFSKTYKLADELITGGGDGERSLRSIKQNSPINAAVVADIFLVAMEADDD